MIGFLQFNSKLSNYNTEGFLGKDLGRFSTTATKEQKLNSQHSLQVSAEPGQLLQWTVATPSIQQYP